MNTATVDRFLAEASRIVDVETGLFSADQIAKRMQLTNYQLAEIEAYLAAQEIVQPRLDHGHNEWRITGNILESLRRQRADNEASESQQNPIKLKPISLKPISLKRLPTR